MTARPFAYTNRDYDSLLADLRRRMAVAIPEWTGFDAGFESVLLEMYSYVGDQLNFYTDRMLSEAFLRTAALRESVLNIASMLGYIPAAQTAAIATVQFTKVSTLNENVTIPAGTQLFAQIEGLPPVYFETTADITILAVGTTGSVTAVEGQTESLELVGSSTGAAAQTFVLHYANVIRDSVRVFTNSGPLDVDGNPTLIEWTYFARLIDANFYDRAFTLGVDQDAFTFVVFGDLVSGLIPPVNTDVFVTYRHGAGINGNVGIGAIRSLRNAGALATRVSSVSNTSAAVGGTNPETIDAMRTSIPRSLSTLERAVSTDDYAALTVRVPGVAKAAAAAAVSTSVTIYVAPVGGGTPSTPLLNSVAAYFAGPPARGMIGTTLTLSPPAYVAIAITVAITVNPRQRQDTVVTAVKKAITDLYAFDQRTFGEFLKKADIFHEVVEVPGVDYVDITLFARPIPGTGTADIQLAASEIATLGTLTVTPTGGVVLP